jgi:hypothetical protein
MLDVTDSPAINELLRYLEDNYGEEALRLSSRRSRKIMIFSCLTLSK